MELAATRRSNRIQTLQKAAGLRPECIESGIQMSGINGIGALYVSQMSEPACEYDDENVGKVGYNGYAALLRVIRRAKP